MILAIILVALNVLHDWHRIEKQKKPINHAIGASVFVVTAVALVPVVNIWWSISWWFVPLAIATRFSTFDPALNLSRGEKWNHYGLEDKEPDALTDKILSWIESKTSKWLVLGLRILVFGLAYWLY